MKTVVIIDYGMGNLRSVMQAVRHVAQTEAFDVQVSSSPEDVLKAERIILPGQGAMVDCMRQLQETGLLEAVVEAAKNKPMFGVCVGMQMLLSGSEEGAVNEVPTPALNLIPGEVKRFRLEGRVQADGSRYKVPQMGWNRVRQSRPHTLWQGIPDESWFYFVHSYYAQLVDDMHEVGQTEYGDIFTSVVAQDNIFATQFHPEKSAAAGLALYRNFLRWKP